MKSKLYKKRLLKLAAFLRTLPARRFNMGVFNTGDLKNDCKTVGCAIGWAGVIFKRSGFSCIGNGPRYRGNCYGDAIESFFGKDTFANLFSSRFFGETPARVAKRIEMWAEKL